VRTTIYIKICYKNKLTTNRHKYRLFTFSFEIRGYFVLKKCMWKENDAGVWSGRGEVQNCNS